jgi:hypothetical protein
LRSRQCGSRDRVRDNKSSQWQRDETTGSVVVLRGVATSWQGDC